MNSQDENAIREAKSILNRQTMKYITISSVLDTLFYFIAYYYKIDTRTINPTLLSLNTNFGVALCAFSLSALAIIYALHDKKIVERFNKTPGYFAMILVFKRTICFCLMNFLGGYIGILITSYFGLHINLLITGFSIMLILVATLFVQACANSIFLVIKSLR